MRTRIHGTTAVVAVALASAIAGGPAQAGQLEVTFDDGNFNDTPVGVGGAVMMSLISNPYWPLSPNESFVRTFTYLGDADDECVVNQIYVDPTDVKDDFVAPYDKIHAQVVLDQEWVVELEEGEDCDAGIETSDENLTERTYDWYAQDIYFNVWYMGEFSRNFEDECPGADVADEDAPDECFAGSWEAGHYGPDMEIIAQPGIVVPSNTPTNGAVISPGTGYQQEVAEGALDEAKILRRGAALSVEDGVAPGDYQVCRLVKEWTALEPGSTVEHKWYCADGPGLVLIEGIGGGPTEIEVLVDVTTVALP